MLSPENNDYDNL